MTHLSATDVAQFLDGVGFNLFNVQTCEFFAAQSGGEQHEDDSAVAPGTTLGMDRSVCFGVMLSALEF